MNLNNSNSQDNKSPDGARPGDFIRDMLTHLRVSIVATIVLGVIVSGLYPAIVWGLAQALFHHQANGSLIKKDGTPTDNDSEAVGSALLGQPFNDAKYFHPRPSAANNSPGSSFSPTGGYDPTSSGGTNFGPLSDQLINGATTQPSAPATQPTTQNANGESAMVPAAVATPATAPAPTATQPAEVIAFDGVRLRTIHYAVDNNIAFKLYHAVYVKHDDGSATLERREQVPISQFQNKDGSLNDTALVDAFPHPTLGADAPDYSRIVLIADDFATPIPADAVTASSSGLDPHISVANAQLQAQRVADARKLSVDKIKALIDQCTDAPSLGILGDPGVNVLKLNVALDNQK